MTAAKPLPAFKYHPDPIATGSIRRSDARCLACGEVRGFIYVGPVHSAERLEDSICPWCIADGTAAERLEAEFTDLGWEVPDDVPAGVTDEVSRRTPGFHGWQQEHWLYHCRDAAAFLGPAGATELAPYSDALEMLSHEHDEYGWPPEQTATYLESLTREGSPTAYLFRCLGCGRHLAYSDFL